MKNKIDYMHEDKHGVITNPEYEILNFPKSYKLQNVCLQSQMTVTGTLCWIHL
jgi:hypothetical protein